MPLQFSALYGRSKNQFATSLYQSLEYDEETIQWDADILLPLIADELLFVVIGLGGVQQEWDVAYQNQQRSNEGEQIYYRVGIELNYPLSHGQMTSSVLYRDSFEDFNLPAWAAEPNQSVRRSLSEELELLQWQFEWVYSNENQDGDSATSVKQGKSRSFRWLRELEWESRLTLRGQTALQEGILPHWMESVGGDASVSGAPSTRELISEDLIFASWQQRCFTRSGQWSIRLDVADFDLFVPEASIQFSAPSQGTLEVREVAVDHLAYGVGLGWSLFAIDALEFQLQFGFLLSDIHRTVERVIEIPRRDDRDPFTLSELETAKLADRGDVSVDVALFWYF
jgi:hypothetical protein